MRSNNSKKDNKILNRTLNRSQLKKPCQLKEQYRPFSQFLQKIPSNISVFKRISSYTANDIKKIINNIQRKAKFNKILIESDERSKSLLHYVVSLKDNIEIVKEVITLVLQSGVDINHSDEYGNTPLMHLLYEAKRNKYNDLEERIKFLVEHGADLSDNQELSVLDPNNNQEPSTLDLMNTLISKEFINNVIKKAKHTLQEKAKNALNYYVQGGIERVSIYGSYAEIRLSSKGEEFQISEFLKDRFCINNGISEFAALHENEKSGMHGFVSIDGVRNYFVMNSSYDMTLNWYFKGEKYTAIININKNGVELKDSEHIRLINGEINKEVLATNKDVRINGLSLIKAIEKGRQEAINSDEYVRNTSTPSCSTSLIAVNSGLLTKGNEFQCDLSNISCYDSTNLDDSIDINDSGYSGDLSSFINNGDLNNNFIHSNFANLVSVQSCDEYGVNHTTERSIVFQDGQQKEILNRSVNIQQELANMRDQWDESSNFIRKQGENPFMVEIHSKDKQLEALNIEKDEIRNKFFQEKQGLFYEIDHKDEQIEGLKNQLIETEAEKNDLSRQVECLQQKFNYILGKQTELQTKLEVQRENYNELYKKYEEACEENKVLLRERENFDKREDILHAENVKLCKQNQAMQSEIKELKDYMESILNNLNNTQGMLSKVKLQLKEEKEKNEELIKWIEEDKDYYEKYLQYDDKKTEELGERNRQLEEVKKKCNDLTQKLESLQGNYDDLVRRYRTLNKLPNYKDEKQSSEKPYQVVEKKEEKALLFEVQQEISDMIGEISGQDDSKMSVSNIKNTINAIKSTLEGFLEPLRGYKEVSFMEGRILGIIDNLMQGNSRESLNFIELRSIQESVKSELECFLQDLERYLQNKESVPSYVSNAIIYTHQNTLGITHM